MIYYLNMWIPLAVLLPSLVMIGLPPHNTPDLSGSRSVRGLVIAEGIGRIGVFAAPLVSPLHHKTIGEWAGGLGMAVFLLLYYAGWLRYFVRGREFGLLYRPLLGISVPLAVLPVLYFAAASVVLHSGWMLLAAVILGAGHIPASMLMYREIANGGAD